MNSSSLKISTTTPTITSSPKKLLSSIQTATSPLFGIMAHLTAFISLQKPPGLLSKKSQNTPTHPKASSSKPSNPATPFSQAPTILSAPSPLNPLPMTQSITPTHITVYAICYKASISLIRPHSTAPMILKGAFSLKNSQAIFPFKTITTLKGAASASTFPTVHSLSTITIPYISVRLPGTLPLATSPIIILIQITILLKTCFHKSSLETSVL